MGKDNMPSGLRTTMFWILGIGIIALILLILLILFGNLTGNVGFTQDSLNYFNETNNFTIAGFIPTNADGYTDGGLTDVIVHNVSNITQIVPATNYTITGVTVTPEATSTFIGTNINISYLVSFNSPEEVDADGVIANYSSSAVNVAKQLPVVGTIIGVAILLLILIGVLIFAITKMMSITGASGVGGGNNSGSSSFKGGNAEFG